MADPLKLTLQVCPAPGDDAGELAAWLLGELLDLDVQGVKLLPDEAVPVGTKDSADIAGLLLVQLDPKALKILLTKVDEWARSNRMVEISAKGHTLTLGRPARQQQEKVIGSVPAPGTEMSRVRTEAETEARIEVTPSVVPNRDPPAPESSKELVPQTPRKSLPLMRRPPQERGELSRRNRLADACLVVKGRIDIEALPEQEARRTTAFAVILWLLGSGLAVLLSIVILAIAKYFHGFSVSTSYPVHRVYQEIVRYFIHITPPPGSPHTLLAYTVYLAVLPVLFAVVFMHLKVGSTRLIVAAVACVLFMVTPFVIVVTSIRVGATNCGSWNYPEMNSGPECYNALTTAFRIAFAVGIAGVAVPIIYLIRGRQHGHKDGLLLRPLIVCANVVMVVFGFISNLAQRRERGGRYVAKAAADVNRYLLPNEQQVIITRRHPAVLIGPIVLALAGPVAAGVLTATVLHGNEPLVIVVWIACLVLFVRMIWKATNWAVTLFVVTSHRMLLTSGVLTRKVAMLPLTKVTDMSFRRSFTGQLLGFGEFVIESAGSDQALQTVDHIPYPEQLYLEICGMLFGSDEQSSGYEPDSDDY
jgi:membrane protein YdbS with pleckstrin-like domain